MRNRQARYNDTIFLSSAQKICARHDTKDERVKTSGGLAAYSVQRNAKRDAKLPLQIAQYLVQFYEVGVQPVEARPPFVAGFFGSEAQHGKISCAGLGVREAGEIVSEKGDGMRVDNLFALFHRKDSP
jgi:hypothetical protein